MSNTYNKITPSAADTVSALNEIIPKAVASKMVYTDNDQTIDGDKTFSGAVIVPTPTADTNPVTKKYAEDTFLPIINPTIGVPLTLGNGTFEQAIICAGLSGEKTGVQGNAKSNGTYRGAGIVGVAVPTNTADTGDVTGVFGYANAAHAGGKNIGVYGYGNSGTPDTSYSFYGAAGIMYNVGAISNPKVTITTEGGIAIKLTNKTGAPSVKGTVVFASSGTNNAFNINPTTGDMPFGVVYEDGIADAAECLIVVAGIADVKLVDSTATTRGYVALSSTTVAGRIDTASTIPVAASHFTEIGHTIASSAGGTGANALVKCVLHFN